MKTFDEYLREAIDNPEYSRHPIMIAYDIFDKDYLASKLPDPLDEWRKLEPGRKVLYVPDMEVWRITSEYNDKGTVGYDAVSEKDGTTGFVIVESKPLSDYQLLREGPFSADKLKAGKDYVYVTGMGGEWDGWQLAQESPFHNDKDHVWIRREGGLATGYGFKKDGTRTGLQLHESARLHFSPPSPPDQKDELIEKAIEQVYDVFHSINPSINFPSRLKIKSILTEAFKEASHES